MATKLSDHFTLEEFTKSDTAIRRGIPNKPSDDELANMIDLCKKVLEPIRKKFGPVQIRSGFRSVKLNRAVGGSATSQHCKGQAADIEIDGLANAELCRWIIANVPFDQVILEFYDPKEGPNSGWVHVSYKAAGNRRSILTARKTAGKTSYLNGIVE